MARIERYRRLAVGLALVGMYLVLVIPARLAGKFSAWFDRWDLETFGW
jgi:hypothetical protein